MLWDPVKFSLFIIFCGVGLFFKIDFICQTDDLSHFQGTFCTWIIWYIVMTKIIWCILSITHCNFSWGSLKQILLSSLPCGFSLLFLNLLPSSWGQLMVINFLLVSCACYYGKQKPSFHQLTRFSLLWCLLMHESCHCCLLHVSFM